MQYEPSTQPEPHKPIRGVVEKIVSHNPRDGYTVLKVLNSQIRKRIETVIVYLPKPCLGVKMSFYGRYHFQNGKAIFDADYVYELKPKTLTALRKYLRSGIINGLGKPIVKNIIRHFGENTLDIFDEDIERLAEVKGISKKKIPKILKSWVEHKMIQETMHFLQSHKLKCIFAVQAFKLYRESTIEKVQENPYRLIQDSKDISFLDVDPAALSMGIEPGSRERLSAAVMHIFAANKDFGHCYLTSSQIYEQIHNLLKLDLSKKLTEHLRYMREQQIVKTRRLSVHGSDNAPQLCYYEPDIFFDELYVAKKISRNNTPPEVDLELIKNLLNQYQTYKLELSDEQVEAAIGIVSSKYSILTGGPGTGKTATLKAIVHVLKTMSIEFNLVAPTGRAAQRITELIDEDAKTIHRLLIGWGRSFRYNKRNTLETDFIIVDESSMLDIHLTSALLKASPDTSQLLFVGDPNQLPAIGPGNILKDLIDSKVINVYRLTQIFRQDEGSLIIEYANQINRGQIPKIESPIRNPYVWKEGVNCFFYDSDVTPENQTFFFTNEKNVYDIKACEEPTPVLDEPVDSGEYEFRKIKPVTPYNPKEPIPENHRLVAKYKSKSDTEKQVMLSKKPNPCSTIHYGIYAEDMIVKLSAEIIPKHFDKLEIQILSPISGKSLGTNSLNRIHQDTLNPIGKGKQQLIIGNKTFRNGDRVIHCYNNYDLGVFNGEIGSIEHINNKDLTCSVVYNGERLIKYSHRDLRELDHAYAITIHKAQGSEFDVVIIPIHEQHHRMLFRSLLYTALTRAKKAVFFVGERQALELAVKNTDRSIRQTALKDLLISY